MSSSYRTWTKNDPHLKCGTLRRSMAQQDEKPLPSADPALSSTEAAPFDDSGVEVEAGPSAQYATNHHGHDLLHAGPESDEASIDSDEG